MGKKINGAAGEKKIGYGVKMLVYNHTATQQTLFCGAKKENGAAGKKKIRGTVPLQTQRAKILRFHHSSHLGDLGVGRGAPKSAQKSLFFFFFFLPKIQNYAMSHNSVYGAISLFCFVLFVHNITMKASMLYRRVLNCFQKKNLFFFCPPNYFSQGQSRVSYFSVVLFFSFFFFECFVFVLKYLVQADIVRDSTLYFLCKYISPQKKKIANNKTSKGKRRRCAEITQGT